MGRAGVFVAAISLALKALGTGCVIAACVRDWMRGDHLTWILVVGAWWLWKGGEWLDEER